MLYQIIGIIASNIYPILDILSILMSQERLANEAIEKSLAFHIHKRCEDGSSLLFLLKQIHILSCQALQETRAIRPSKRDNTPIRELSDPSIQVIKVIHWMSLYRSYTRIVT